MTDVFFAAVERTPKDARIAVASQGMMAIPHLPGFLGGRLISGLREESCAAVIGWGNKPSGRLARAHAHARGVPFTLLEDGFIRSVGLGKTGVPPVSVVLDDCGIYFDARGPSRFERLLRDQSWLSGDIIAAAASGLDRWRHERLTKYNTGRDARTHDAAEFRVVLIDQVAGDASIPGALATAATFRQMFERALQSFGAAGCCVRTHPDAAAGKARGYLTELARRAGVAMIDPVLSAHAVLDRSQEVWTVSSGMGFEAILRGVPVVTFGVPFYAGFGLTRTEAPVEAAAAALARRGGPQTVLTLFAAAFIAYARYADPVSRRSIALDGAMDRLIDWRRRTGELATVKTLSFGFSRWKRPCARAFLGAEPGQVVFGAAIKTSSLDALISRTQPDRIAIWGALGRPDFEAAARRRAASVVRVEDGFVRSVGLGSDLRRAGSLVVDDLGIYYDATRPSRLERLISDGPFSSEMILRAQRLRARLIESGMTKYNLGSSGADLTAAARGRKIVLVAEQVPGDAALRLGSAQVASNLALLEAVRAERPGAFIVYKEHPDVVAGNRAGRLSPRILSGRADLVISSGDLASLYGSIDEIHVISSLAGFEALCRGVRVCVWGRPFYGGWGLTDDRASFERRSRTVSLDELIAAALILYPRYVDPVSGIPCSVEDFLDSLDDIRARGGWPAPARHTVLRQLGRFWRWLTA